MQLKRHKVRLWNRRISEMNEASQYCAEGCKSIQKASKHQDQQSPVSHGLCEQREEKVSHMLETPTTSPPGAWRAPAGPVLLGCEEVVQGEQLMLLLRKVFKAEVVYILQKIEEKLTLFAT